MKFVSLTCIFSVVIILFGGCKREPYEDTLPPVTNWGARTFGCKVNGINWALHKDGYPSDKHSYRLSVGYRTGVFHIVAEKFDADHPNPICQGCAPTHSQIISLEIGNYRITKPGYYEIPNFPNDEAYFDARFYDGGYSDYFIPTSITKMGRFNITRFDTISGHFAGTFDFVLYDGTGTIPVFISAGRFDF